MAILPLADYERLVEAAEEAVDVRAYDSAKRRLASGEEELLPAAFADRIIDGEPAIKVWREYRKMSARALAAEIGVSAPFLSQIENGQREGSFETMKKIAAALNVALDDL
ncbi:helix-turn-helix transcriptional regulator [Terrarubrum flagellatum]|uniref:helix-turn-helix domain-containing protein n=1 Tax=Terrirubrum flagellatum TaxID=2895980 RepID=UPI003144E248